MIRIKLKEYMIVHNLKERDVAKMTGLAPSTINVIKNEKTSPTLETLYILAKGLHVKLFDLVESELL